MTRARTTASILVTAFGRFPGAPENPTGTIARRLVRRFARSDQRVVSHVFATRYDAVDAELPALLAREAPDVVVLLGVAMRAAAMRLELVARNRASVIFPDAGGRHPERLVIDPGGPSVRPGRFPVARARAALRLSRLPARLSRDAGRYLCNYTYWKALDAAERPGGPRLVVFVHVPPSGAWVRGHGPAPRAKVLAGQTRALAALITTLGAEVRRT